MVIPVLLCVPLTCYPWRYLSEVRKLMSARKWNCLLYLQCVCNDKILTRVLAPCSMQGPSLPARNCIRKKIEKYLSFKGRPAACKRRLWEGCQVRHRLTLILTNYMFRERNGAELNKQRNVYNRLKASVQISNIYSCSDKLLFSFFVVLELFPMSIIEKQL